MVLGVLDKKARFMDDNLITDDTAAWVAAGAHHSEYCGGGSTTSSSPMGMAAVGTSSSASVWTINCMAG